MLRSDWGGTRAKQEDQVGRCCKDPGEIDGVFYLGGGGESAEKMGRFWIYLEGRARQDLFTVWMWGKKEEEAQEQPQVSCTEQPED